MESITIHFGPKKVSSEDDEASTKKQDDEEETFKGPKGRTNVWWKDVKYTPPKKTGPAKRVNLFWKRDLKKKVFSHGKHGHWSGQWKTCDICTLPYPCNHMSGHDLKKKLKERYEKFPVNDQEETIQPSHYLWVQPRGKLICEEFFKYQSCRNFEKNGKCKFWHPTEDLINKPIPLPRCDVCTKLIFDKYCYKHRPPFGKELCDEDKNIMKLGGEVSEMFKLGEMIGYNSALERKIIYGFVVTSKQKNRAYEISVTKTAKRVLQVTHGKLYRIRGYVSRGWDQIKNVKKLYKRRGIGLEEELKSEKVNEGEGEGEENEGEKEVNWGRMFNVKYEKSLPNVHPDEYLDRPDTGGPIVFELEED